MHGCGKEKDEEEEQEIEAETIGDRACKKKKIKRPWERRAKGTGHGCGKKKDGQEEQ